MVRHQGLDRHHVDVRSLLQPERLSRTLPSWARSAVPIAVLNTGILRDGLNAGLPSDRFQVIGGSIPAASNDGLGNVRAAP